MTTNFRTLWDDPGTPNRDRKRLLAHIIEDATLIKIPAEGITKTDVRFKGGQTETLTTVNPKSSAQQVKTPTRFVELIDELLDDHIYSEIAVILNQQGLRPGGSARLGRSDDRFTALRVAYLAREYDLRSRYDRLRDRGMLTKAEAAARLNIYEATLLHFHGDIFLAGHDSSSRRGGGRYQSRRPSVTQPCRKHTFDWSGDCIEGQGVPPHTSVLMFRQNPWQTGSTINYRRP